MPEVTEVTTAYGEYDGLVYRAGEPGDLVTKSVSVRYDPEAACPIWERCVREWLPDEAVREWVRRFFGYCLTGRTNEQVMAILYGDGANGKSAFINAIIEIMGDYCMTVEPQTLLEGRGERVRDDLADLRGVRLIVTTELPAGRRLDEALVKRMTGNDPMRVRRLYGRYFTFTPAFKVVMVTNHKPIIRGTEHAIWRRIRLVPFTVKIPEERQDRALPAKLRTEYPGVLNWLLGGLRAWLGEGLPEVAAITEATAGYRSEMDTLADFIEDHVQRVPASEGAEDARTGHVYARYIEWCRRTGVKGMAANRLIDEMRHHGFATVSKKGFVWYRGCRLKETAGSGEGAEGMEISFERGGETSEG